MLKIDDVQVFYKVSERPFYDEMSEDEKGEICKYSENMGLPYEFIRFSRAEDASVLEGDHIRLRKAKENDWESMLKNVWGNEAVYRWMLFQPTLTKEEARERCRRSIIYQKDHLAWFVALKDTDEAIGLCAIRENEKGHFEESGICIGTEYQGRGYGKEIVSLLLAFAFHVLDAEDIRYGYFQDNERSKKLAGYFGFQYDKTYDLTRPWDGAVKRIDSCILTRKQYEKLNSIG